MEGLEIAILVQLLPHKHVGAQRAFDDPRHLGDIRHAVRLLRRRLQGRTARGVELPNDGLQERGLARGHGADNGHGLPLEDLDVEPLQHGGLRLQEAEVAADAHSHLALPRALDRILQDAPGPFRLAEVALDPLEAVRNLDELVETVGTHAHGGKERPHETLENKNLPRRHGSFASQRPVYGKQQGAPRQGAANGLDEAAGNLALLVEGQLIAPRLVQLFERQCFKRQRLDRADLHDSLA
mmetsp:Transcript_17738/g.46797  ORF Transcript_17738/g.46797 Transcript_17738/m.46797 type:complete len:240 (-) Transcript_17738:1607-2326(-)